MIAAPEVHMIAALQFADCTSLPCKQRRVARLTAARAAD
jgi:hypothetical protein